MDNRACKEVLRKYFSNIVYIDDTFDTRLVEGNLPPEPKVKGGPPLPHASMESSTIESEVDVTVDNIKKSENKLLERFLQGLGMLADVRLAPMFFDSLDKKNQAVEKMLTAPLTIIDWDLGSGIDAYDVIEELFTKTEQLKVIVVYTDGYEDANDALDKKLSKAQEIKTNMPSSTAKCKCVKYKHKSIIFLTEKNGVNLEMLLTAVTDCFFEEYGAMPVALLDVMSQIAYKSGRLFGDFCAPFDGMYFLQSQFANEGDSGLQNALTNFLLSKVKSDVSVDEAIVEEIPHNMISKLASLAHMSDEELSRRIKESASKLRAKGVSDTFCDSLTKVSTQKVKESAASLKNGEADDWQVVIDEFRNNLGSIDGAKDHIKKYIWPTFVQMLLSGENMIESGAELVRNMMYNRYEETSLKNLLNVKLAQEGNEEKIKSKNKQAWVNKLHFGDILVNTEKSQFLMCITPPCDVYMPSKAEFNISYILGKLFDGEDLGEKNHISLYPDIDQKSADKSKIVRILWNFHKGIRFDLSNEEELKKLCEYEREYRFEEQYARQIANMYIAYYSRAGVDDLFIKKHKLLESTWI